MSGDIFEVPVPEARSDTDERTAALEEALAERLLVLDGATGTAMQALDLGPEDFGGPELEGCNENLCALRPDVVELVHDTYLRAGADIVETNTFGATPLVLAEYGLEAQAFELNRAAAEIARRACRRFDEPGRPRFVCGSMGPTTKAISVTGGVSFDDLQNHFRVQAAGLMSGGADYLLLETCQDTRNIKAGLLGIEAAFEAAGWRLPVAVSVTIEPTGTMLAGQDAEALAVSLLHCELLYVGLNCATGPELMSEHLRTLSELSRSRVACVPNAGLPDEEGEYVQSPDDFREVFGRFLDQGWLNLVGGCCGTTDDHISALVALVAGRAPRRPAVHQRALVSGIEAVELTPDNRPLLVGERTNVLGSRKFRRLIAEGEWEAAAEVGRAQVRGGAQIVDVCLQDPDRDELGDMDAFLDRVVRLVKVPLMIDSTDAEVMERALTWCQGKAILNSINLEDGLARFERVAPLIREYGAAVVVGLIDESGMAVDVERKLEVASRSFRILTEDFGLRPEDLWFDALVFPCGTGDPAYIGSGGQTIEAVRRLEREFPDSRTILGISNVSFGLPTAGREILNSVFLYHATLAGLDAAIVNSEKLARFAEIPPEERDMAEELLFLEPGDEAGSEAMVARFAEHFRGQQSIVTGPARQDLPLDQRIARAVVEGSKEGLTEDLDAALADPVWPTALDIVNGPLMGGMAEVGALFNDNKLIVAEVLQSAEVMKAAVAHLEPHMEKSAGSSRGKVMLATVKGDVHDIGKNLVDIVLSNNGFEVVNLGIKVPSEQLIQAAREHRPDVIGLSGLLVKSAHQMVVTAGDLQAAGLSQPLLVGGAALSRRFTHLKIAAAYGSLCTYASDAMHGLQLVGRIMDEDQRQVLITEVAAASEADREAAVPRPAATPAASPQPVIVRRDVEVAPPPDLERHTAELDLEAVWELINPRMLYGKHLGLKGSVERLAKQGDARFVKLEKVVDEVKQHAAEGLMSARAVWRFFAARGVGERIVVSAKGDELGEWEFPRQRGRSGLCLADYLLDDDHLALFVTTATGVRDQILAWKDEGEYLRSHVLAALALETAEAAAEWLHRELRTAWGFADPADLGRRDLFAARYRGRRFSFGYPACPDLTGQRLLFELLEPTEIGVELTEGDMMDPEASVSALVVHHPEARYFAVGS